MMLNGSNFGSAVKGVFDNVAKVLAGGEKENKYADAFEKLGKQGRNLLHDYGDQSGHNWSNFIANADGTWTDNGTDVISNDERLAIDQAGLANIANYLLGRDKSEIAGLLNYNSLSNRDLQNSVQLFQYGDRWEFANATYFDNMRASPGWMSGDFESPASSFKGNHDTRFFYSNEMIAPTGKPAVVKSSYTFDSSNKVESVRVWVERQGSDMSNLDITVTKDGYTVNK